MPSTSTIVMTSSVSAVTTMATTAVTIATMPLA
jgi:hypothetical protein